MNDIKQIIRAFRDGINPVTGEIFYKTVLSKYPMTSNEIIMLGRKNTLNVLPKQCFRNLRIHIERKSYNY